MDQITCMIVIKPQNNKASMKYITGSRDGTVKIWNPLLMQIEKTIKVTNNVWITSLTYMTRSKKLVVGTANRMISFYDMQVSEPKPLKPSETLLEKQFFKPYSRIEGLVGVPHCLDYYEWPLTWEGKPDNVDGYFETLFVGNDLGIIDLYHFTSREWHVCHYMPLRKDETKKRRPGKDKIHQVVDMTCCADEFEQNAKEQIKNSLNEKALAAK